MEVRWSPLNSNVYYKTLIDRYGTLRGWVVLIDGKWIARTPDATIRADFDTMDEAQQFLTIMVSAGESNEDPM